jgi:rRNA pseudouridine-1189 N-methylase Emg1 (Nep1/Mra1 family)
MLYLILAESGLELIPNELGKHPAVRKNISRFGDIGKILDVALHHSAMKNIRNSRSRGRPDIVHKFLIDTLASILNKWNLLRIFVHTYDDRLFEINPYMRPPKDYNRFKGVIYRLLKDETIKIDEDTKLADGVFIEKEDILDLKLPKKMEDLFTKPLKINKLNSKSSNINTVEFGPPSQFLDLEHFIEDGEIVLLRRLKKNLNKLIEFLRPNKTIMFTTKGSLKMPDEIFAGSKPDDHIVVIIGGFQSGGFSERISKLIGEKISIFPIGLESWTVINRVLSYYEQFLLKNFS